MTVRRDTSKGLDQATSFVVFTTESGRILLSSGLTPQSLAKEVQHTDHQQRSLEMVPGRNGNLPDRTLTAVPAAAAGCGCCCCCSIALPWLACAPDLIWGPALGHMWEQVLVATGLTMGCAPQTAKPTMRIMGVHTDGKFQLALLKFKAGSEAEDFAQHVAEHRPKA